MRKAIAFVLVIIAIIGFLLPLFPGIVFLGLAITVGGADYVNQLFNRFK